MYSKAHVSYQEYFVEKVQSVEFGYIIIHQS